MAKRKSTRGSHFSRNRGSQDRSRGILPDDAAAVSKPAVLSVADNLDAAIEAARTKLMRARAVLDCTRFVLLYDDPPEEDAKRPSFSDAIDVARDLVDEVIDALDRVNLRAVKK